MAADTLPHMVSGEGKEGDEGEGYVIVHQSTMQGDSDILILQVFDDVFSCDFITMTKIVFRKVKEILVDIGPPCLSRHYYYCSSRLAHGIIADGEDHLLQAVGHDLVLLVEVLHQHQAVATCLRYDSWYSCYCLCMRGCVNCLGGKYLC